MEIAKTESRLDPITFEIVKNRIFLVTEEMSIALRRISGSTTTTEANDYEAALYTPEGDLAAAGWGVTAQVVPAGAACKHIVNHYSRSQIREGDVFVLNDPYVAAFHQSDIFFISPIHFEGDLVGWAGNFTHIIDIGAVDPGGFSPSAKEVYQEGLRIPSMKLVKQGQVDQDLFDLITNNSREPGVAALDMRSQLAANNVAKERLHDMLKRYGRDVFNATLHQTIDNSEIMIRSKLKELPDGNWSSRIYVDIGKEISKVELCVKKKGSDLQFDFTGTSPQAPIGMNCTIHGARGSVFTAIAHMLGWNIPWNEGLLRPVSVIAPEGSLVNCKKPAPVSMATIGMQGPIVYASSLALSNMMRSNKKYRIDSTAVWGGSSQTVRLAGRLSDGQTFVSADTDHLSSGGGALFDNDGIDTGGRFTVLRGSIANIEYYELHHPVLYLFRRQMCDSGGAGKFRGGVAGDAAKIVRGEEGLTARLILTTVGMKAADSLGIFGGYPGSTADAIIVKDAATLKDLAEGVLPASLDELKGEHQILAPQGVSEIAHGDVFYRRWSGGGGYGDPVERDPRLVQSDVHEGLVSPKIASSIYGVLFGENGNVDMRATVARREEIAKDRLLRGKINRAYQKVSSHIEGTELLDQLLVVKLHSSLEVICRKCLMVLGDFGENWKSLLATFEIPLEDSNPLITNVRGLTLRQFACPSCGLLIDSEITRSGDPFLANMITINS
jgi:N-methylhydantoinase B